MPLNSLTTAIAAAAGVLLLAGCSSPASGPAASPGSGSDAAFPVTIEHAFGQTVIEEKPVKVVTLGWGSADAAIAMGVVPVAIPFQSYGGDSDGVLPWIREAVDDLGADLPAVLPNSADEPPYEEIAAADPDVIIAAYSGITEEQYQLLTQIAPTVAYPGEAWSTPWRDVVRITAEALGTQSAGEEVLADIDAQIAAQSEAHPEFAGQSIAAVWDVAGTFYVYKDADPRVEFLLDLGFVSAPSVDELANGDETFYYTLSYEQLDKLSADVVLSYSDTQEEADAFVASSYGKAIPAVAAGNVAAVVGTQYIAAVSPPTALSLPWGLEELVAALAVATAE
ncbi:iron-siderophore ABC transporter substrate-binding protein [soil metagenome]